MAGRPRKGIDMRMLRSALLAGLVGGFLLAVPAAGGGSATATIDSGPSDPKAGTPIDVGILVLQHGVTPISWEGVTFVGTRTDTGETVSVKAAPKGPIGRYVATVTFPSEGTWETSVRLDNLLLMVEESTFPAITVLPAAPAPTEQPQGSPVGQLAVPGLALVLALALVGSLFLRRRGTPVKEIPVTQAG
jgi:hypothetical protein